MFIARAKSRRNGICRHLEILDGWCQSNLIPWNERLLGHSFYNNFNFRRPSVIRKQAMGNTFKRFRSDIGLVWPGVWCRANPQTLTSLCRLSLQSSVTRRARSVRGTDSPQPSTKFERRRRHQSEVHIFRSVHWLRNGSKNWRSWRFHSALPSSCHFTIYFLPSSSLLLPSLIFIALLIPSSALSFNLCFHPRFPKLPLSTSPFTYLSLRCLAWFWEWEHQKYFWNCGCASGKFKSSLEHSNQHLMYQVFLCLFVAMSI